MIEVIIISLFVLLLLYGMYVEEKEKKERLANRGLKSTIKHYIKYGEH